MKIIHMLVEEFGQQNAFILVMTIIISAVAIILFAIFNKFSLKFGNLMTLDSNKKNDPNST